MPVRDDALIVINIPQVDGRMEKITLPPDLELDMLAFAEASGQTLQQILDRAIANFVKHELEEK